MTIDPSLALAAEYWMHATHHRLGANVAAICFSDGELQVQVRPDSRDDATVIAAAVAWARSLNEPAGDLKITLIRFAHDKPELHLSVRGHTGGGIEVAVLGEIRHPRLDLLEKLQSSGRSGASHVMLTLEELEHLVLAQISDQAAATSASGVDPL